MQASSGRREQPQQSRCALSWGGQARQGWRILPAGCGY